MEKGFNDDELADIMNEIESLEKEFSQDSSEESEITSVQESPSRPQLTNVDDVEDDGFAEMAGLEDPAETQEAPIAEVQEEPVTEVQEEPVTEVQEAPIAEVQEEPVTEVQEEPVAEVHAEPVAEVQEEPVAEVQEEPVAEVHAEPVAEVVHEEPVAEVHSVESSEVLGELSKLPENKVIPVNENKDKDGEVHSMASTQKSASHETSMEFSVQGEMKLNLTFHVNGKKVSLAVNENDFNIELDGGMKFSIPLDSDKEGKKAA